MERNSQGTNGTRTLGVIPARLASTRLPRKVLREIAGRPMLQWVVEAALRCSQLEAVLVATDSDEVARLCATNGWPYLITSPELPSGSDRVFAAAQSHPADIYVNIQADEPLLEPAHISALLEPFAQADVEVSTLCVPCTLADAHNPNAVKVVRAIDGRALYFSRATVPYDREHKGVQLWKHLGLYAYRSDALARFHALAPSPLEQTERLEQLRFLENGIKVYVAETTHDTVGVDTEEDLHKAEQILLARQG